MNPEDYEVQGILSVMTAGEDLRFGEEVKLKNDLRVYKFTEDDELYNRLGWAAGNIKKGESGDILHQGLFVPKDHKQEYLDTVRRGVAFEILSAMASLFGFTVHDKG